MIDAKIKGEGLSLESLAAPAESNVIDLMAALRKSLGEPSTRAQTAGTETTSPQAKKMSSTKRTKAPTPEDMRRQPGFKLPITGGQKKAGKADVAVETQ